MKTRRLTVLLVCLLLLLSLSLGGCSSLDETADAQDLATGLAQALIDNDLNAGFELCRENIKKTDFRVMWNQMRAAVEGARSWEMRLENWQYTGTEGTSRLTVTFRLETDNGKTCRLDITTEEDKIGITEIYFHDATEFLQRTAFVPYLNILLALLSLGGIGFCIWMLVDAIKRPLKLKGLFILLVLFGFSLSVSGGLEGFDFNTGMAILLSFSYLVRDPMTLGIGIHLALPVGAIVYCCLRPVITRKKETEPPPASEYAFTPTDGAENTDTWS